jgi:hypothetical protein
MNNNAAAIRATCFSDRSWAEERNRHNTAAAERSSIALSPPKASSAGLRAFHAADSDMAASTVIQRIVSV